jgi:hypothetical protein
VVMVLEHAGGGDLTRLMLAAAERNTEGRTPEHVVAATVVRPLLSALHALHCRVGACASWRAGEEGEGQAIGVRGLGRSSL